MTGNQTMDYYVRPRHLYLHSRTCTHSGLCRRISRLVESLICYLLDRASFHEISALVTWFQYVRYFQPLWRSWSIIYLHLSWISWSFVYIHHGYFDLSILYMVMTTHAIVCIIPIHGHCTLMYPGLLYAFEVICKAICTILLDGWFFHLVLHHSTSGMNLQCISTILSPL